QISSARDHQSIRSCRMTKVCLMSACLKRGFLCCQTRPCIARRAGGKLTRDHKIRLKGGTTLNRLIKSSLLIAGLSLVLAAPVYGEGAPVNANKAGTYNATRTDTSYAPGTGIYGTDGPTPYYNGTTRMYNYNNNG